VAGVQRIWLRALRFDRSTLVYEGLPAAAGYLADGRGLSKSLCVAAKVRRSRCRRKMSEGRERPLRAAA
jgi:hypothetical protein